MVQLAAKAAMRAAPNRQKILTYFAPNEVESDQYEAMKQFTTLQEPIRVRLFEFYE